MPYRMPIDAVWQRHPQFGGDAGYQTQGPFNFGTGSSWEAGLNMAAPVFLPGIMQRYGLTMGQFSGTQNLHDQMMAQQYQLGQQRAMAAASSADIAQMQRTIMGAQRLASGRANTMQERQQAFGLAQNIAPMTPFLSAVIGPEMVDQLYGVRGSASMMAQALHRSGRTGYDPVTGGVGMTGDSAGAVSRHVYRQLYGDQAKLSEMKGIGAGSAGMLYEELSMRGYGAPSLGRQSVQARAAAAAAVQLSDADIGDIAERTQRIQALRKAGTAPQEADFAAARQDVRDSQAALRRKVAAGPVSLADMSGPEAQDMMRAADAQRIAGRLKNMAGAVTAMREIFGDLGKPNAPMREIINGLEQLTGNGLATMSPARVEAMVRQTAALAKQTGIGVYGIMGMTAQAAQMGAQLGLDPSLAIGSAQGAAAFGGAARNTQRFDLPVWGGLQLEQLTAADLQLRTSAAGSSTASQLNAAVRMLQEGMIKPGTDAARLAEAVKAGKSTFTDGSGRERSVAMGRTSWQQLMTSSGVNGGLADSLLRDTYGSQEYGRDFNTQDLVRSLQFDVDLAPRLSNAWSGTMIGVGRSGAFAKGLQAAGLTGTPQDFLRFSQQATALLPGLTKTFTQEELRSNTALNKAMAKRVETSVMQAAASRVKRKPGESDAAYASRQTAAGQAAVNALGPLNADGVREQAAAMGAAMIADMTTMVRNDPGLKIYNDARGMLQAHNVDTMAGGEAQKAEARATAQMQSALGGLGSAGILARSVDAVANAKPGEDPMKILMQALGGVDNKAFLDTPQVKALLAVVQQNQSLDRDPKTGRLTTKGQADGTLLAAVAKGLVEGGEHSQLALNSLATKFKSDPAKLEETLNAKINDPTTSTADKKLYETLRDSVSGLRLARNEGGSIGELGRKAGLALDGTISIQNMADLAALSMRSVDARDDKDLSAGEREAIMGDFLSQTRSGTGALLGSLEDMKQLGAGSVKTVTAMQEKERRIRELALQAGVTPEKLLAGNVPGFEKEVTEARRLHEELADDWRELNDTKGTGKTAAARGDREMSAAEEAMLADVNKFAAGAEYVSNTSGLSPADIEKKRRDGQIDEITRQVIKAAGGDESGAYGEIRRLVDGRELGLKTQLAGREQLLRMAAKKKLLKRGDKEFTQEEWDKATSEEQKAALDALDTSKMTAEERADYDTFSAQAKNVKGIEDANLKDLQTRLKTVADTTKDAPAGGPGSDTTAGAGSKQKMAVTGTLTLLDPHNVLLNTEGEPDTETNGPLC